MKQQLKRLSLLALAAALAACANEEGDTVPRNLLPADGQIRVIATVNAPATRAGATTESLQGFGLFVVPYVVNSAYKYNNVYMNKEASGAWQGYKNDAKVPLDAPMMWQNQETMVQFGAYAPYSTKPAQMFNFITDSVRTAQDVQENVLASDFLRSISNFSPRLSNPTDDIHYDAARQALVVKMNHHLSKLRVNIRYVDGIDKNATVEAVSLQGTNVDYEVVLANGEFLSVTPRIADITLATEPTESADYVATREAIVVPQEAQFKVCVRAGGSEYLYTHPSAFTFESGKRYTLNLTVGKMQVSSAAISSEEWSSGNGEGENLETD